MWLAGNKREFTHFASNNVEDDKLIHWEYQLTRKKPSAYEFDLDLRNNTHEHCTAWIAGYCEEIYLNKSTNNWIKENLGEYDGDPIEVELYIDNEKPLFYVQRMADSIGIKHLYTTPEIYGIHHRIKLGIWPFRKTTEKVILPEQISKELGRLPMRMFPEITEESGIVGISLKLKK